MTLTQYISENWNELSVNAQDHIRRTRPQLLQRWILAEEGDEYDTVGVMDGITTVEQALECACENVCRDNYPDAVGTLWIRVQVRNAVTGEIEARESVACDEDEPKCVDAELHDWKSPYSVVRGMSQNPGVFGHGGGVIITEVCRHCGTYRVTDTWAQDPDTGEQGLTSVEYRDADADSMAWIKETDDGE